eukprot:Opistho-2@78357
MLRYLLGVSCCTLTLVGSLQRYSELWRALVLDLDDLPQLHFERTQSEVALRKKSESVGGDAAEGGDGLALPAPARKRSDAAVTLSQVDVIKRMDHELRLNTIIIDSIAGMVPVVKEGTVKLNEYAAADDRTAGMATAGHILDAANEIVESVDPMEILQTDGELPQRWLECKKELSESIRTFKKLHENADQPSQHDFALQYLASQAKDVSIRTTNLMDVATQVMTSQQQKIDSHQRDLEMHNKKIERARGKMTALDDLYKNILSATASPQPSSPFAKTQQPQPDHSVSPDVPPPVPPLPPAPLERKVSRIGLIGVATSNASQAAHGNGGEDLPAMRPRMVTSVSLPVLPIDGTAAQKAALAPGTQSLGPKTGAALKAEEVKEVSDLNSLTFLDDESQKTISGHLVVKAGTLEKLVERLTHEKSLDPHYPTAFMLTYRSFTSPEDLLALLLARFKITDGDEKTKVIPVRLRVFNALKLWINTNWDDFKIPALLEKLKEIIGEMQESLSSGAGTLNKLIEAKTRDANAQKQKKFVFDSKAPQPILPPENMRSPERVSFLDIDPLEIARQLTLIEFGLFASIQPKECLDLAWTKSNRELAPGILGMIERSNKVSNWVATEVLKDESLKNRIKIVQHIVNIADKCRSLNNFNCVMAIIAGMTNSAIFRMKRTWEALPSKTQTQWNDLKSLMSEQGNFSRYRQELHSINPPVIPFLGIYLTDLVMIETGNKSLIKPDKTELINFDKRRKIATVIQEIQRYQQTPYHLQEVDFLRQYLLDVQILDTNAMYERSLFLEPREARPSTIPNNSSQSPASLRKGSIMPSS